METFSVLLDVCVENSLVPGELPIQRPVTWIFDVFFDLRLNKWLSKQSWGWWLRRYRAHYDVTIMVIHIPVVCGMKIRKQAISSWPSNLTLLRHATFQLQGSNNIVLRYVQFLISTSFRILTWRRKSIASWPRLSEPEAKSMGCLTSTSQWEYGCHSP